MNKNKIEYDPSGDEEIEALRKTLEYVRKLDFNGEFKKRKKADNKKLKKSA